jgi:MtN3 and saliva related transmembrane protein
MEILASGLAATLTTLAFVPQALHIIRHKETRGISLLMYLIFSAGVACWLWFGILIWNWPMMVANAITLGLALYIVYLKLRHS